MLNSYYKSRPSSKAARFAGASLALVALLGVTACSGNAQGQGLTKLTVGHTSSISSGPLFIALEKGYFEEEGLDVELLAFKAGGDMVAPLSSGDLAAGIGGPAAGTYNAIGRGLPVKFVADAGNLPSGNGYSSLMVSNDLINSGQVDSVEDLRGLHVGQYGAGSIPTVWFDQALSDAGLDQDDIQSSPLSGPDQAIAMENGAIDAATLAEPYATMLIDKGVATRLAPSTQFYPDQQFATVMYGTQLTEKMPDEALAFMRGWLRGAADYEAAQVDFRMTGQSAGDVISVLAKYTKLEAEILEKAYVPAIHTDGLMNIEGMSDDLEFFRQQGLIDNGEISMNDAVDISFVEKASAQLADRGDTH